MKSNTKTLTSFITFIISLFTSYFLGEIFYNSIDGTDFYRYFRYIEYFNGTVETPSREQGLFYFWFISNFIEFSQNYYLPDKWEYVYSTAIQFGNFLLYLVGLLGLFLWLASKKINISSPSISSAIAQLEEEFSIKLFIRKHASGLELTKSGEKFALAAQNIVNQSKDLYNIANNLTNNNVGNINLGCLTTLAPVIAPSLRKKYTEKNNKVNIIQHEGNQADLIDYIISGKIDLAVTYNLSLPKNISFIPLINVPPHVLVNANHKFSKLKEIDLNDIKDEPLILLDLPLSREYFLSIFEAQNIKPKISEKTSQISVLRSLVAHNFGYSLANLQLGIPQSIDGLKISQIPLKGEHQSLELGLAIADLNYIPSLTNEFIEFAKTIYKEDN